MKKTALLLALVAGSYLSNAQLTLTGTSYSQNFDVLTGGLPTGWTVYTGATATAAGTLASFNNSPFYGIFADTINCLAIVYDDGFKNYASASASPSPKAATCDEQRAVTNRAIGVRQKGGTAPAYDPGAAFVLKLANTSSRKDFTASFKLQSLDTTSPRITTWSVQYGIGSTPVFTDAAPVGTMTTGGFAFSNNTITVNFGSALDNQSSTVWIRIAALSASSASGNRTSSAIDDFQLNWAPTVSVANIDQSTATSLTALGNSTSDKVELAYRVNASGKYILAIYDLTGRTLHTEEVNATTGDTRLSVNGLNLPSGLYIAKLTNGLSSSIAKFNVQ